MRINRNRFKPINILNDEIHYRHWKYRKNNFHESYFFHIFKIIKQMENITKANIMSEFIIHNNTVKYVIIIFIIFNIKVDIILCKWVLLQYTIWKKIQCPQVKCWCMIKFSRIQTKFWYWTSRISNYITH